MPVIKRKMVSSGGCLSCHEDLSQDGLECDSALRCVLWPIPAIRTAMTLPAPLLPGTEPKDPSSRSRLPDFPRQILLGAVKLAVLPPGRISYAQTGLWHLIDINLDPVVHSQATAQDNLFEDSDRLSVASDSVAMFPAKRAMRVETANRLPGLLVEVHPDRFVKALTPECRRVLADWPFAGVYRRDAATAALARAAIEILDETTPHSAEQRRTGDRGPATKKELRHIADAIIARVGRLVSNGWHSRNQPYGRLSEDRLSAVIRFVEHRLPKAVSVAEMAEAASLSQAHFARCFAATTGRTPAGYVNELRMEKARELLRSTASPVYVIAEQCGFSDPSHFGRAFRKFFGTSPAKARRDRL